MLKDKEIQNAKHIVIVLEDLASIDYLCSANALYTYLLQKHKKVSLYCSKADYDVNLSFLPWLDKLKTSYPSSADYEIKAFSSIDIYKYFIENKIALNPKMATSLYAGLLDITKGFRRDVDGTIFAMAKVLLDNKADAQVCNKNLLNYQSLASLRLKSILLAKMNLEDNATKAIFYLDDEDLSKSGAKQKDSVSAVVDALGLPTVKSAVVIYKNKEIFKEEII